MTSLKYDLKSEREFQPAQQSATIIEPSAKFCSIVFNKLK